MKKTMLFLMVIFLLTGSYAFANDVSIDSDGNVTTGISNTDANLEVTGASGEDGIVGSASGTGASGVYGENTTSGNYGLLGDDNFGVYGESSSGWAGYFRGNARVTGNLTLDGLLLGYTETDPQVGTLSSGMWCTSDGISVNCKSATPVTSETDPVFGASAASGITSGQISNWDTAYGWGNHASAGYDTTNDSWTGTGDVYTTSGNVGIGTSTPQYTLDVRKVEADVVVRLSPTSAPWDGTAHSTLSLYKVTDTDGGDEFTETVKLASGTSFFLGNVGIGTATPGYGLDVRGSVSSYLGYFNNDNNTSGNALGLYAMGDAYDTGTGGGFGGTFFALGGSTSGNAYGTRNYAYAYGSSDAYGVYSNATYGSTTGREYAFYGIGDAYVSGNVGIGTTSPARKLSIGGTGSTNGISVGDDQTTPAYLYHTTTALRIDAPGDRIQFGSVEYIEDCGLNCISLNGNVGIGTSSPTEKLTVRGNILIEDSSGNAVMELGEGLDYAEGFDVSDKSKINSGTVLIIDPENPGKLMMSNKAYDTKVAGIVAGANGLGSGVRLGADRFDSDVALAGRVYCNVDTTEAGIKPGDLLTTANIAGYAMKATDYQRAQGAILGKAMESLEKGKKGQILVLVTLQ